MAASVRTRPSVRRMLIAISRTPSALVIPRGGSVYSPPFQLGSVVAGPLSFPAPHLPASPGCGLIHWRDATNDARGVDDPAIRAAIADLVNRTVTR